MSDRLCVRADDVNTLAALNITCSHSEENSNNKIYLMNGAQPSGPLELSFGGDNNHLEFNGPRPPSGRLWCMGADCEARIDSAAGAMILECYLYNGSKITIKSCQAIFGLGIWAFPDTSISIGEDCLISDGVQIFSSDHHSIIDLETNEQINFPANVELGEHVWIGKGAMLLKGAVVERGAIVGAKAIVTGRVPTCELWGGSPAKLIRRNVSWVGSDPAHPDHVAQMRARLSL